MLFLAWSFAVYLLLVAGVETKDDEAKCCSLNTVLMDEISSNYSLQENPDIHLTLQHIYRTSTFTQVMDENRNCIVGLNYKNQSQKQNECQVNFASEDEYTTLVFQQLGHNVTVYQKDSIKEKVTLTRRPQSLWVNTSGTVNVLTDCPGNCYQFEQAVIHKHYPEESETQEPIIIYGRIKNTTASYDSTIGVRTGEGSWPILAKDFIKAVKQKKENIWFSYAVKPSFTKCQEDDKCPDQRNYLMDIVVTDLSTKESIPLKKSSKIEVNSTDLYLGFRRSSNIRWAFCKPRTPTPKALMTEAPTQKAPTSTTPMPMAQTPSGHFSVSLKEIGFWVLLGVCSVLLLLLIGQWILIRRQRRQLNIVPRRTVPVPTASSPPTPGILPEEAAATLNNIKEEAVEHEEDLSDHEYDYIDIEALQRQVENERGASGSNVPKDEASGEKEETSQRRVSHTSINSLYGCILTHN